MQVVLAEKPSVAGEIAAVLGAKIKMDPTTKSRKPWYEGNGYIVTWAIGHLVGPVKPNVYLGHSKWLREDMPILPTPLRFEYSGEDDGTWKQYNVIKKLFELSNVESIVCATDAGREGEGIFYNIYESFGCQKEVKRLWVSSLTEESLRQGFKDLKNGTDYVNLRKAAKARSEADWYIGMNSTRALGISQNLTKITVGRVVTPTLCLICKAFEANRDFKPEPYYQVKVMLTPSNGGSSFFGTFPEHYKTKEEAQKFIDGIGDTTALQHKDVKEVVEKAPLPYDLTSLQVDANKKYRFSPDKTLSIVQLLYESKIVTYPRVDVRYLGDEKVTEALENVSKLSVLKFTDSFADLCNSINAGNINKSCFDSSKLSDHSALQPTFKNIYTNEDDFPMSKQDGITKKEARQIFEMITTKYVEALLPVCKKEKTNYKFDINGQELTITGSTIKEAGWRGLSKQERNEDEKEDNQTLPLLNVGDLCAIDKKEMLDKMTKKPPLLTEASLLQLMEGAGKLVDDEEQRRAIKDRGIGTAATRASVIKKLFTTNQVEYDKNYVVPTKRGFEIYDIVKDLPIGSVATTGDMEFKLKKMEQGEYDYDQFIEEIKQYTSQEVDRLINIEKGKITVTEGDIKNGIGCNCPKCGKPMKESEKSYYCSGYKKDDPESCNFSIWKIKQQKPITLAMVKSLVSGGSTGLIKGLVKKDGSTFDAEYILDENFELAFKPKEKKEVGTCPDCGAPVIEMEKIYFCSKECGFKVFRSLGGHIITEKEFLRLVKGDIVELPLKGKNGPYKQKCKLEKGEGKYDVKFIR